MPRVRILVVDDDPVINKLISDILQEEGWEIYSAQDGEEAIRMVHENPPDLIILDLMMPKINGLEVCRHVTDLFQIPIIMISGQCDTDTKVKCLNMGAEDFITKPFSVVDLIHRVKTVLQNRNLA
jgi:DNA-binding response OmpR family regulator